MAQFVDLLNLKMVIVHSKLLLYQRVTAPNCLGCLSFSETYPVRSHTFYRRPHESLHCRSHFAPMDQVHDPVGKSNKSHDL